MSDKLPAPPTSAAFGTSMVREFGALYHLLGMGRNLGRIHLPDPAAERVRQAAMKGPVIYVMQRASSIDQLTLNTALNARNLPLATWSNGPTTLWWQRWAVTWATLRARVGGLFSRPDPVGTGWLADQVAAGRSAAIFLEGKPSLRAPPADPFTAVLDAQARTDRPIQIVPVLVAWDKAPQRANPGVRQFLLGAAPLPDFLGGLGRAWFRSNEASVQVGEPLDLQTFRTRIEPELQVKVLRTLLRRALRSETEAVRGPRLLPYETMRRLVLDNPAMKQIAADEARIANMSPGKVRARMEKDYKAIAAHFQWWVIRVLEVVLKPLWTRVFSGVDIRPEDVDRIRTAMRNGTVVLMPCHKSHLDYLLLGWVFFENDLSLPHVVAGMNLAIWPVSIILRGAGGFFVKRSFSGDRIFPAVFSRYLRELIRQGYPVEFFIEGGRTRSGKLLPPKVGVLGMVMEAAELRNHGREVTLLPMALAYEQVAEERAYAAELGGQAKQAETFADVVRARSVLRRRFGRVYVRVGEPIETGPIVDRTATRPAWSERDRQVNKEQLYRIGERVLYRVGQSTVTLPTSLVAAALLAHHRRGIRGPELQGRLERFRAYLLREGMEESASLEFFDQATAQALDRFAKEGRIEAQEADGQRVWAVTPEQRIILEFYKNQVLHAFTGGALAAAAIRGLPATTFDVEAARPGMLSLTWLLRREFALDPDRSVTDLLRAGVASLVAHGATDGATVTDAERMGEIYGLLRPLLESYALVVRADRALGKGGLDSKALPKALQADADALMASGAITRPESLSLVNLQNAVASLVEDGVLVERDGTLHLDPDRQRATLAWLAPMVD